MKRYISRKHADHLKRMYMKAGLDQKMILGIQNRKAALYDILVQRKRLEESYEMHRNNKEQIEQYCCND